MSLADRQTAALTALAHRQPPAEPFPGETQPSGDMPLDWRQAVAWLDARDRAEGDVLNSPPGRALYGSVAASTPSIGSVRRPDVSQGPHGASSALTPPVDCDPSWPDAPPGDRKPGPFELRQAEIRDMRDQGPRPVALWTATDIPANQYL